MAYLRLKDYYQQIQQDNLAQVISNDSSVRLQAERAAQAEMVSYLVQKYVTGSEFTDTTQYNNTKAYKAAERVDLDFIAYSATSTYTIGDLVTNNAKSYRCSVAITAAEAFNPAHWTLVGNQYDTYYVTYPNPVFSLDGNYLVGDKVWWKDKVYTCAIATQQLSHDVEIQYITYGSIPSKNVFPDDPMSGLQYWGTGTSYTVPAGTLPSDASKWTLGDNRNPQVLLYLIDIVLYHLHSRIAPRNIPQIRMDRYDAAIAWLKMVATGEVTADIIRIQPKSGARTRFGGNVKNINSY